MASKLLMRNARMNKRQLSSLVEKSLWTSDNIVKSPYKDVVIPETTLPELIWQRMDRWPDKTAIVCGITNRSYTYHQLFKKSKNFAANLRSKLNLQDGDKVCVMMPNMLEYPTIVLGVLEAGAIVTTVNPLYTSHELQKQLSLSDPKIIIGSIETFEAIRESLQIAKKYIPIIIVTECSLPEGTISFKELCNTSADHSVLRKVTRIADDIALLPYSSGTTGLPKGVELNHKNIVVNCLQQDVEGVKHYNETTGLHQDAVMCVLPFYHIYALSILLFHKLSVGAKLIVLPKFQPETFVKSLVEHKISLLYAAPPLVLFLASHRNVKEEHLKFVNNVICGAAPLPKIDIERLLEKTKPETNFIQIYGLTETSPLVTAMVPGALNYTTVGLPISNTELKVVDSELRSLGPNKVGELLVRGPQVMKGYKDNPEATRNTITEDNWLKTGDLVSIDHEGSLTIADRIKELIKVKGYQVPPAELESLLKEHPDILDAAVIGIPDQRLGEAPKAFIVLEKGRKAEVKDIYRFVNERVTEYKRLKDIVFIDSLPKNPSGKLLRRVLKDQYT